MRIIVKKFGGTSVSDISKMKRAASHIKKSLDKGFKVAVVVSAMGKETDRLMSLSKDLAHYDKTDDLSALLSSGELVSSSLMAITLNRLNIKSKSYQGWQIPIFTDENSSNARIIDINIKLLKKRLSDSEVPVISGFQGINKKNRITTLGRGGSDTTAVALAAKLKAERCDIYTDVEGVFSADPRIVPEARKMNKINYEEMLELSSLGAKVLHTRSVQIALRYNVNLQVLSSVSGKNGTMLTKEDKNLEQHLVRGIAHNSNDALITLTEVKNKPGISAMIFSELSKDNINVDMIVQSGSTKDKHVTFAYTVAKSDANKAKTIMLEKKNKLQLSDVIVNNSICKVSVVGLGMKTNAGVANTMFGELAKNNINIHVISTSEIKISVLIDDKYKELAIRSLHKAFKLSKTSN
tara:strand:+ start:366 stop:1592 length:1227 start_codon:yes stop_codon:yes gene_type:complete